MTCKKAIIPIAGYGTRRLPITKAIEKCMLPVGNRPVIDYIVEDCIRAGITEFLFVVGEEFDQIRRYYGQNQLLEEYLENKGKKKELKMVRDLDRKARFHYVVQDQYQPYGTTVPIWLCRHLIKKDEKFLVVFGDQFFYRPDGSSELADFIKQAGKSGTPSAMLANEVNWNDVSHYGIVVTKRQNGRELYEKIIEKPSREEAPTNLSNASCFVLDSAVFPFIEDNMEQEFEGEHFVTDALNSYSEAGNDMAVIRAKGEFLDCGTTEAWLHTNQRILGNAEGK
jgi:UTP--glucose-1-phosphate uridylyltransferase